MEKRFILKFNASFSVLPKNQTDLHQPLLQKALKQLPHIFSKQAQRTILNDFTFSFKNQWYQLTKEQPATICKKNTVMVEEHLDHSIHVRLRGKYLNYCLLPQRPEKQKLSVKMPWVLPSSKAHTPPPNHPWRLAFKASVLAQQKNKV